MPDEYTPLVITALEHYYAYTRAVQREDKRYEQVLEFFKRKGPAQEERDPVAKRKRGSNLASAIGSRAVRYRFSLISWFRRNRVCRSYARAGEYRKHFGGQ